MVCFRRRRQAVASVEAAIVFPVIIFLILAIVIGSMGIFRYQEVCFLTREGARYASVHGTDYQTEVKSTAATADDVYNKGILPRVSTLDTSKLTYSVTWNKKNSPYTITSSYSKPTVNTVTVTLTYKWMPEMFLVGPITFSTSSTMPVTY